jgi:hypothetical protein
VFDIAMVLDQHRRLPFEMKVVDNSLNNAAKMGAKLKPTNP